MRLLQKGDASLIKNINQQIILNLIRIHGSISGAALSKMTKLQAATVSKILKNFAEIGFIEIDGRGKSTNLGGKRPTLWKIAPNYGYIIGIEVLPYEIRGSIISLDSRIVYQVTNNHDQPLSKETVCPAIKQAIEDILQGAGISEDKIIGIGLGVSGLVNSVTGIVRYSIGLGIKEFELKKELEKIISYSVTVANDANAAVLGEKWLGIGKSVSDLVYIAVNEEITGIGCGFILDNKLFIGKTHSAGELILDLPQIHKMFPEISPEMRNSLILDEMGQYLDKISMLELVDDARSGSKLALNIFDNLGRVLGREVARIINFINPELIILGGDIIEAKDLIKNPLVDEMRKITLEVPRQFVKIEMTEFGRYAVSMGAAALIMQEIFQEPHLNHNYSF